MHLGDKKHEPDTRERDPRDVSSRQSHAPKVSVLAASLWRLYLSTCSVPSRTSSSLELSAAARQWPRGGSPLTCIKA